MRILCSAATLAITEDVAICAAQFIVGHGIKLHASDCAFAGLRNFQLAGDGECRSRVIAGYHDGANSCRLTLFDGMENFLPRRVDHAHESREYKIVLIVDRLACGLIGGGRRLGGEFSVGER